MGRDKRDVTDAEQIAHLLRTGMTTRTQLEPEAISRCDASGVRFSVCAKNGRD